MDHFNIIMGLISLMFTMIVGVYAWTWKISTKNNEELAKILLLVNGHLQEQHVHADSRDFVSDNVCKALHTALKEDVSNIKEDVAEVKSDIKLLLQR